jgi:glutamate-1-semialdehyde 2,1-aminomutase
MSAIRVARGYTGRNKIIKFEGCYHGHGDSFLIGAGSGALTFGIPDSKGVTAGVANDTLTATFNDLNSVQQLVNANPEQIAAIILEPVVGNMGLIIPKKEFIYGLRDICNQHQIVLIFDEVMTGFRLSLGGAQELLDIQPDMTTLGKIIGGGLPVGAFGGKKEIMDCVAPKGSVYQAGTLSGNPVALSAGLAMLNYLKNNPHVYHKLEAHSWILETEIRNLLLNKGISHCIQRMGSMFTIFFTHLSEVNNLSDAKTCNTQLYAKFFHHLLENGVYGAPSQFEAWFVSTEINEPEIEKTLEAVKKFNLN